MFGAGLNSVGSGIRGEAEKECLSLCPIEDEPLLTDLAEKLLLLGSVLIVVDPKSFVDIISLSI
jgi:hypothetical protein